LETYGACPFRFFIESALRLEERKPPEIGYDAAQLGNMLHSILELVYKQAGWTASLEELQALLRPIGQEVFTSAPQKFGFRPTPLWEVNQAEMLETLARGLEELAALSEGYRPAHFELKFGSGPTPPLAVDTDCGPVTLRGMIDRVDIDDTGNIRVIDYKTGSSGFAPKDLIEGKRLQLPLYALACSNAAGLGLPADGFYWSILAAKASQLRLANFKHISKDGEIFAGAPGAMDLCISHIGHHVDGIRKGQFGPQPAADGCPEYCVARLFCWRYRRGSKL
jgi:hypothetical protein